MTTPYKNLDLLDRWAHHYGAKTAFIAPGGMPMPGGAPPVDTAAMGMPPGGAPPIDPALMGCGWHLKRAARGTPIMQRERY